MPAGYLEGGDLPDTGCFAFDLVTSLRSRPRDAALDVWVHAVSESVPRHSTLEPYCQFLALREARSKLSDFGQSRSSGPFVHTMFGKTLTSFAVTEFQPATGRRRRGVPADIASYALGPLGHCRLDNAMSPVEAVSQLMRTGWVASVASALSRKQRSSAWHAESVVKDALTSFDPVDHDATLELLKAFAAPPWRGDSSDFLTSQRALEKQGRDLHFPELLRERAIYADFASRRSRQDQYLLATDVHGLFRGRTRHWAGLVNLLLPVATQFRSGAISFPEFIDDAYRIRLSATRKLRATLASIAAVEGLERSSFGRGDGVFAFAGTLSDVGPNLERLATKESQVLPFGVGIVKLSTGLSFRDALARAEAALCITKLAEPTSTERVHYLYGDSLTPGTRRLLDAALKTVADGCCQTATLTKENQAIQRYRALLAPLVGPA